MLFIMRKYHRLFFGILLIGTIMIIITSLFKWTDLELRHVQLIKLLASFTQRTSLNLKMFPDLENCVSNTNQILYLPRKNYWVIENYIPATEKFQCEESITYTTHSEFMFLDNLEFLVHRWKGPISVAVFAVGYDLKRAIKMMTYLRSCNELVKKYVTFHLVLHRRYLPYKIPTQQEILKEVYPNCRQSPNYSKIKSYRSKIKNLLYPINLLRNVARTMATTYFVLPSDIELYPSGDLIPEFLKMIKRPDITTSHSPRVYVLPIFEVEANVLVPETKKQLLHLLRSELAISFHEYVCPRCHRFPYAMNWRKEEINPWLSVFHIATRTGSFSKWEPIYIGTNNEPLYDDRLSWEGLSDKMPQMAALCSLNYEFHILDNAFLVHRPGIKRESHHEARKAIAKIQSNLIQTKIKSEYELLFGLNTNKCKL